ncbi:MAG TPA: DUF983 domain-containing protein [Candidatus Binatia bacterium]|nr:DUF983 domain-containing protein [Candidatus Binatia bacterium]
MRRLLAFLRLRCPHCLQGPIFYGFWQMHSRCQVCGIEYEREQGFFMNAIFFGYILGFVAILPLNVILYIYEAPPVWFLIGTLGFLTLLSPLIFRYSRALWMHLDEMMDPRDDPSQPNGTSI